MGWLSLSLLSALSLASADAATKYYLADYSPRELVVTRFGVTGLILSPLIIIEAPAHIPNPFWYWLAALMPLEILAMWLYMRAITTSDLARTLPYLAFTPVFATGIGYIVLNERVTPQGFGGIALITAGAWLLNLERPSSGSKWRLLTPFKAILHERGARLMLAVALIYSITSVLGKGALQYVSPPFFGALYFVLLFIASAALFSPYQPRLVSILWRRPGPHLLIGSAMATMVITHLLAIQQIEVAYMIAVKRTSLLFGIAYGALLFREPHLARHLAAGLLMVIGVALIAL
jgi:drug/metabolite transporter (DMT)-like permease